MAKRLLVVVDMQNDFIDGSLGTKEAVSIVDNVCKKISEWDGDLFVTQDTHYEDYMNTAEGKMLPVPHCISGTPGHLINPRVTHALDRFYGLRVTYEKPTFGSTLMSEDIHNGLYDEVQFCGLCTDICVLSNAIMARAALPEARIIVDAACCAGVTPESHRRALDAMKPCHIEVINDNQ